ncbi:T-cell surface protein tactile isoform X1 [Nannospalax galili]|uniref:T-cell surface protein tactile isoform X1 n=1 Tax=Nannospalax galili TaxID=1026970 RepID=UPI0004ED3652|nr:T-cell surface protein tactile isoform X1 [Nannospalax galili]
MGRKWTYCAVYSIIQIQLFRGVWEEILNARKSVYAPPGSDVNLTCQTQKGFLVQMQWSKVTDKVELIAIYHPQHGFHCPHGHPCESHVASIETPGNATKWTLHLRNVSSTLSGKYECSFTLYPEGIQNTVYNLLVQAPAPQDEWGRNYTIEIEINQTLEIPCFQNTSSETSCGFTFEWLVDSNGTQEALITHNHQVSNSTLFKDRVKLGADCGLHLYPVQIHDDGRIFSCHLGVSSLKVWKTSTTVKVFAKPEGPMIVENTTMDVLGERRFTCLVRNVFPKANIKWLVGGRFLQGDEEGIQITNEKKKDRSGFWELKSILTKMYGNRLAPSNVTVLCMALSSGPGNKTWKTSSEIITLSLDSENSSTEQPPVVTESTPSTQLFPDNSSSPRTSRPNMSTESFNHFRTFNGTDAKNSVSWTLSETYTSAPSDTSFTFYDVITSTIRESPKVSTVASEATKNNSHIYITSIVVNKPRDGMSWPVVIAILLCFCIILFGLGVRKWCQYQKEIMERPPPFKPPPPPIKYTCMQEPIGSDLPCHEMEAL